MLISVLCYSVYSTLVNGHPEFAQSVTLAFRPKRNLPYVKFEVLGSGVAEDASLLECYSLLTGKNSDILK